MRSTLFEETAGARRTLCALAVLLSDSSLPGNTRLFDLRDCPEFRQLSNQLDLLTKWKLGNSAV